MKSSALPAFIPSNVNQSRRAFVMSTAGIAVAAVASSGCQGAASARVLVFPSLMAAEQELARLADARELASSAAMSWAQTLAHCAQSIEYSMTGYPQAKSRMFQHTAGAAAFTAFSWRGRMTHDLAEPIPGAPALEARLKAAQALERLRAAILSFRQWTGTLQPHFAYGELSKSEYELAHAMHLANHFSVFDLKS